MTNVSEFYEEIVAVLSRHEVSCCVVGIVFLSDRGIETNGRTFCRNEPRDAEENLLRDKTAQKAATIAGDLFKNTYDIHP
jgi:hypothetical protein